MKRPATDQLIQAKRDLSAARDELEALKKQIQSFEELVDSRLGELLDQLTALNTENLVLEGRLREIREQRLFGDQRMSYVDGAPAALPTPRLEDLPPPGLDLRLVELQPGRVAAPGYRLPDIKELYRKLARRYHPDLAGEQADQNRLHAQMVEINRMYAQGNLRGLMNLAGLTLPFWRDIPESKPVKAPLPEDDLAGTLAELSRARDEINQLRWLPSVQLSLKVKLRRHEGRDLLKEMAADLRYRLQRKQAMRDYLSAQIRASGESGNESTKSQVA